jgi:hypothetical protein
MRKNAGRGRLTVPAATTERRTCTGEQSLTQALLAGQPTAIWRSYRAL